jgi:spermidine synthase
MSGGLMGRTRLNSGRARRALTGVVRSRRPGAVMPPRSPAASPRSSFVRLPGWAAACFVASGAAGLLYEVVWSKQLAYLLGNSLHSVATVVAAFLAGLALGAWLLGSRLAHLRNGARTYALLESGIALLGLASMPVLRGLDPLIGLLYRGLGGESTAFALVRLAVLFVVLLPPTVLMGATLPVLVAHFEYRRVGPALARLYALNTAGAVLGSVLAGFFLLPAVGLSMTTWVAALFNVGAALLAWRVSRRAIALPAIPTSSVGADTTTAGEPAPLPPGQRRIVGALFALSGVAALVFQIAWIRLFGLLFGSSVYSFAAVLAIYLAGLALGSGAIAPRLRENRGLVVTFAWIQGALGLVTLATAHAFHWLPEAYYALILGAGGSWTKLYAGELLLVAGVLAIPCVLLGAVFPLAARLLQTRDGGHATGVAYAVNTVGTLAGSLLAGFALIPAIGSQGTHLVAAGLSLVVAVAALSLARARRELDAPGLGAAALGVVVAGGLALTVPAWDSALMSAGIYRPSETRKVTAMESHAAQPVFASSRHERTLFYREGINGSVYVASDSSGRYRWLKVGGKTDASTGDMLTQVLLGVLPGAMAPPGARAAVIGLGSGITLSGVLATGVRSVDVMEIEPAVVAASRFFDDGDRHPLADPRVTLVLTDARTLLFHAGRTWDVIVSEPSNPWIAGVNGLFTEDFYHRLRGVLSRDGVFCQWVQLYELSPETLGSMLGAFLSAFPEGHAFFVAGPQDLLLIAAPPGTSLPLDRLRAPEVRQELARAQQLGPESIAAWYACPLSALVPLTRGTPRNRDDRPVVEYRAPRDLYRIGRQTGVPATVARIPYAGWNASRGLFAGWTASEWFSGRVRQLEHSGDFTRALAAAREAEQAGLAPLAADLAQGVERDRTRRLVMGAQDEARRAAGAGRMDLARDALLRAVTLDPGDARALVLLAETLRRLGDGAGAESAAMRVIAIGAPADRADASVVRGLVAMSAGEPQVAAEHFRDAERWMPVRLPAYVFEAQALRSAGDPVAAAAVCRRGLAAVNDRGDLEALLRELGEAPAAQPR